jgi:succinyl-diaminopimelate desuccinylase
MPSATKSITDTLTALLTHLVRFPTITGDNATNRAALDWVEQQLHGLPLDIKRLDNHGVPALVATTPGVSDANKPKLWLMAHMDVVAGEAADFTAVQHQGRLYGRGSHDMKFAIACFIALLRDLGPDLPNYDLGLLLTCDEEAGGRYGARWLVQDLGYRGSAVFVPDSSTPWKMQVSAKGIARFKLTANGQAAHASRPWQGSNAIDTLMAFANQVRSNVPTEPCTDPHHRHNTVNLSTINGGLAVNQVPASATAEIDVRYNPDTNYDVIAGWIEQAKATVPNVDAELIVSDPPYHVDPGEAGEIFKAANLEIAGQEINDHHAHGSSDDRWFGWVGVPAVNVGVIGSGYHTSPEWVDIADLVRYYKVTQRFVTKFSKNA